MGKISAIICELNPAHDGHRYIFSRAREISDTVVAIMSGNYVQRGECAIYDKYTRAEAALQIGADVVFELPFPWSAASAEFFASAGVSIAEALKADYLVFGSESGDVDALKRAAEITKRAEFFDIPADVRVQEYREKLLYKFDSSLPAGILSSANDILGIEYIKNLNSVCPMPYKRTLAESASSIRQKMSQNKNSYDNAVFCEGLFDLEYCKFRLSRNNVFKYAECSGGVGERLYRAALSSKSGSEMLSKAKTKQYTNARFRRAALYNLTETDINDLRHRPFFTNLLAFNSRGREYLSVLRRKSEIEILTKPSRGRELSGTALYQFESSAFADSIYTMLMQGTCDAADFLKKTPIVK